MQSIWYILIAILLFGVLIAVHEAGHFLTAKAVGVKVNEFAIGMGPKLWRRQGAETEYTLRLFPIGGFCAMEGEDEASGDPRAFGAVARWRQLCILLAGSVANFLAGLLVLLIVMASVEAVNLPVVGTVTPNTPAEGLLLPGDRVVSVDGRRVLLFLDVQMFFDRAVDGAVTLEIDRAGTRLTLPAQLYKNSAGDWKIGFVPAAEKATLGVKLRECFLHAVDFVRMVWFGLSDMLTGRAGLSDLSGPIGIVSAVGEMGAEAKTVGDAVSNILFFMALIAVNLAVMNLLPIPALDGGRILFLFVGWVFMVITKRKLNPKFEGYINAAGLVCLLALMAVVAVSDVIKLL